MNQSGVRTREWLLIVLLIIAAQYIIAGWVENYGGNPGVINYVSFAGTIVSIILAILAIVYAYFQNFAQQRDSATLAAQIELLRGVVSSVRSSQEEFGADLRRIDEIRLKLDESLSLSKDSNLAVKELSSHVRMIRAEVVESVENSPPADAATRLTKEQKERLVITASQYILGGYYALCLAANGNASFVDVVTRYGNLANALEDDEANRDFARGMLAGMVITAFMSVTSFGLATIVNQKIVAIDGEFEEIVRQAVQEVHRTGNADESSFIRSVEKRFSTDEQLPVASRGPVE